MTVYKIKWHLVAGVGTVILFLLLLAIRLDIFSRGQEPSLGAHNVDAPGSSIDRTFLDRETWMNISQNGQKIGYSHRQFSRTDNGYRIAESVFMRINTMGVVQGVTFKTEGNLNSDMSLSSFDFVLRSSLFQFKAHGDVKGKQLTLYTELPGSEKKTVITLKQSPHLASGILEYSGVATMKTGESRSFAIFDPSSMGQRTVKVSMLGDDVITIMGSEQKTRKVSVDFLGVRQFAWIGKDGDVVKEQGIFGLTLEQVAKHQALDRVTVAGSADMTEIASVTSNVVIDDPAALTSLRAKITNIEKRDLFLDGGRQSLIKNVLLIEKETIPTRPFKEKNIALNQEYLKPSPFIQSDHKNIRDKVQEIVSPDDPAAVKASKLVDWVHKSVVKRPVLSVPNALETLNNLVGDCNEHAVLLAALARAAGIPAQVEAGLVYQRGKFYYHAWNVLYLGTWVTADAVMGQMPADVTHIRFVRGEAERQIDLIGVIGKVGITVIEKSR